MPACGSTYNNYRPMKRIFLILLSAMAIAGCSKEQNDEIKYLDFWTENAGEEDQPVVFLPEVDAAAWNAITDLEERFIACKVPYSILKEKSTKALGLSILHYPLNYIILAYNYYDMPVKTVYDHSSLHRELASRKDAAEVMAAIFENTDIDMGLTVSKGYGKITLGDGLFLEYFLGSGLIEGLDKGNVKNRLKTVVTEKRDERLANKDVFGDLPLISLAYISERWGLDVSFPDDIVTTMHQFTLEH